MSMEFEDSPFIREDYIIPDDESERNIFLREYFNSIAASVNDKESGIYSTLEVPTGASVSPSFSQQDEESFTTHAIFRKIVNTGALPNNATKSVAHGIDFTSGLTAMKIMGTATRPSTSIIPIPGTGVSLNIDATNVNLVTTANMSAYTRSFVIIEYIKSIG